MRAWHSQSCLPACRAARSGWNCGSGSDPKQRSTDGRTQVKGGKTLQFGHRRHYHKVSVTPRFWRVDWPGPHHAPYPSPCSVQRAVLGPLVMGSCRVRVPGCAVSHRLIILSQEALRQEPGLGPRNPNFCPNTTLDRWTTL